MNQTESIIGCPEPQHWPTPMSRFGLNPYSENLYRIVFAPSVKRMVGGEWPDGAVEYRFRPKYRALGNVWILEKWISAFEDSKMTPETYKLMFTDTSTGLLVAGPYPHHGVYTHVHTFESVVPGDCNLEWLIGIINKAKSNDPVKVEAAIKEHYQKQEATDDANSLDRLRDAMPSFGLRSASFGGHVKSFKAHRFDVKAKELWQKGMPIGRNKAVTA